MALAVTSFRLQQFKGDRFDRYASTTCDDARRRVGARPRSQTRSDDWVLYFGLPDWLALVIAMALATSCAALLGRAADGLVKARLQELRGGVAYATVRSVANGAR